MTMGVLSVHLDGKPCAVACPFCYLGARQAPGPGLVALGRRLQSPAPPHPVTDLETLIGRLDFAELAIAVSEPVDEEVVLRLCAAAHARRRPATLTTTLEIAASHPRLLSRAQRLNLSVDAWKIDGDAQTILTAVQSVAEAALGVNPRHEIIALATLATPTFAALQVEGGLLTSLVDSSHLSGVALSALKPPPPFCDRSFWLRTLATLRPLLDRALDRRLFLDCYVAARLLALGPCPGRADLSPGARGLAFRSCVYAARADFEVEDPSSPLPAYVAPALCPFDTRLE